jgi:hypothetical protein
MAHVRQQRRPRESASVRKLRDFVAVDGDELHADQFAAWLASHTGIRQVWPCHDGVALPEMLGPAQGGIQRSEVARPVTPMGSSATALGTFCGRKAPRSAGTVRSCAAIVRVLQRSDLGSEIGHPRGPATVS